MIRERAINFKAREVTAIIEDKKTQLRRVLDCDHPVVIGFVPNGDGGWWKGTAKSEAVIQQYITTFPFGVKCPYGVVGDRLWVRESWSTHKFLDDVSTSLLGVCSVHYWADGKCKTGKKRSSAYMPRKYSRVLLEIINIRVERLNDISESDCLKEGIVDGCCLRCRFEACRCEDRQPDLIQGFAREWSGINGFFSNGSGKAWRDNPWVWVIEFKIIQSDTAP